MDIPVKTLLGLAFTGLALTCAGVVAAPSPKKILKRVERKILGTPITLTEMGDPEGEVETMTFDPAAVRSLVGMPEIPSFNPEQIVQIPERDLAVKMTEIAENYVGVSRASNPDQVNQFVRVWCTNDAGVGEFCSTEAYRMPYCAMGVAYSACRAYCDINGIPYEPGKAPGVFQDTLPYVSKNLTDLHPSCGLMRQLAIKRKKWIPREWLGDLSKLQKGWLVLFDFPRGGIRDGRADHIGIVAGPTVAPATTLATVEFNTTIVIGGSQRDGGAVARKERSPSDVLGYIRTY